jgi:carbon storage regulator CsrA
MSGGRLTTDPKPGNTRLTVKRRPSQAIHIGDDIIVTIIAVQPGGTVVVNIEAPQSTRIHRHEHLAPPANPPTHGLWNCGPLTLKLAEGEQCPTCGRTAGGTW